MIGSILFRYQKTMTARPQKPTPKSQPMLKLIRKASYVGILALLVAVIGVFSLQYRCPIGPIIVGMALIPLAGLLVAKENMGTSICKLVDTAGH
jgi:hypothetical protein